MNNRIEKIKNYNQVILAIAGTVGLLFVIWLVGYAVWDMTYSWRNSRDDAGILSSEQAEILQKENLRKQIISFSRLEMVDSASQTYIIPVSQANLIDAEKDSEILGLSNNFKGDLSSNYYGNIYNNLVIYDGLNETSDIIFKDRISIADFSIHETEDKKYLVIPGCNTDSNKDGLLNELDLQELFVFDLLTKKLQKIESAENYTTIRTYKPEKTNDLIVHFGIDRNNNGKFERSTEPMVFYKVNLQKMSLQEFVNNDQISTLQGLLEGKEQD